MAGKGSTTLEEFMAEAINQYNLGAEGNQEAAHTAYKMFRKVCFYYPKNFVAQAYLGGTTILAALSKGTQKERQTEVSKGLKLLDRAVSKEPENPELRRLRVSIYKEMIEQGFEVPNNDFFTEQFTEVGFDENINKELGEAREMHRKALNGDRKATKTAFSLFEKALEENPENYLVMAYYADCLSMIGWDSNDTTTLFGSTHKAMAEFDKAVNGSPDNIEIRLIRAENSVRLPELFFRRSATAIVDFEYLIQRYERDNGVFGHKTYLRIIQCLAESYERLDMQEEAQTAWSKLLSLTGDEKYQPLSQGKGSETYFDPVKARSMNWDQALQEGIRLHKLAVAGNKKAAKIAEALLKGIHQEKPKNPLAMGYYASGMALAGLDSKDVSTMFGKCFKGLKLLDEAVSYSSEDPKLRILRGHLAYNLPEAFFHSGQIAADDYNFLIRAYQSNRITLSKKQYRQILKNLGSVYERLGDNARAEEVRSLLEKEGQDQ